MDDLSRFCCLDSKEEKPMSRLNLTSWQRRRLRRQLAETRDARVFRRTLAVLEFDHGRCAADIARMLGVTRQSIYDWVEVYTQDHDPASLEDEGGRGRQAAAGRRPGALAGGPPRRLAPRSRLPARELDSTAAPRGP